MWGLKLPHCTGGSGRANRWQAVHCSGEGTLGPLWMMGVYEPKHLLTQTCSVSWKAAGCPVDRAGTGKQCLLLLKVHMAHLNAVLTCTVTGGFIWVLSQNSPWSFLIIHKFSKGFDWLGTRTVKMASQSPECLLTTTRAYFWSVDCVVIQR